jgi:hypothetical protein
MAYCSELLRERGFRIYIVPEAATCIALGGGMINVSLLNSEQLISFQSSLMKMQMNFEDRFAEIANNQESEQPAVLLCDRGRIEKRVVNCRCDGRLGLHRQDVLASVD